ncbi:MAG: hypothetical protein KIT19_09605 [Phycisphaeraceae bacterium]|nr:hypothetical protein [Phycisphaeraceae bacterium]
MRRFLKPTLLALAAILFAGASWYGYRAMYANERDALLKETADLRRAQVAYEKELQRQQAVRDRLAAMASTTLGKQFDRVDHRLRTGLSRVGQDSGLADVVVSSTPPKDERNPAAVARNMERLMQDRIKKSPNFSVVRAQVKGTGTLPQVLQALATYSCQPWIHRIDTLTIRPVGRERERFELKLDVATIWMPDLSTDNPNDPPIVAPGESGVQAIALITAKNVFKVPTPPPRTPNRAVVAAPPQPQEPAPPFAEWKLTGVISGRRGVEALMLNMRDGERRVLSPGTAVLGATLVSGAGEEAVFELEGTMWTVRTGATLADRIRKE